MCGSILFARKTRQVLLKEAELLAWCISCYDPSSESQFSSGLTALLLGCPLGPWHQGQPDQWLSEHQTSSLSDPIYHLPVFLPGESHGQSSLAGYSPWGRKGLDMTE